MGPPATAAGARSRTLRGVRLPDGFSNNFGGREIHEHGNTNTTSMEVSINEGTPKLDGLYWTLLDNPDDWGYHYFKKPPNGG